MISLTLAVSPKTGIQTQMETVTATLAHPPLLNVLLDQVITSPTTPTAMTPTPMLILDHPLARPPTAVMALMIITVAVAILFAAPPLLPVTLKAIAVASLIVSGSLDVAFVLLAPTPTTTTLLVVVPAAAKPVTTPVVGEPKTCASSNQSVPAGTTELPAGSTPLPLKHVNKKNLFIVNYYHYPHLHFYWLHHT